MSEIDDVKAVQALEGEDRRDLPALLSDESPSKKQETAPRWAAAIRGFASGLAESFNRVSSSASELFRDKDLRKKGAALIAKTAADAASRGRQQIASLMSRLETQISAYQREKQIKEHRKRVVDVQIGGAVHEDVPQEVRCRLWMALLEDATLSEPFRPIQCRNSSSTTLTPPTGKTFHARNFSWTVSPLPTIGSMDLTGEDFTQMPNEGRPTPPASPSILQSSPFRGSSPRASKNLSPVLRTLDESEAEGSRAASFCNEPSPNRSCSLEPDGPFGSNAMKSNPLSSGGGGGGGGGGLEIPWLPDDTIPPCPLIESPMIPSDPMMLLNIDELLLPHRPSKEDLQNEKAARELLSSDFSFPEGSSSKASETNRNEGVFFDGGLNMTDSGATETPRGGDSELQVVTKVGSHFDDWEVLPTGEDLSKSSVPSISIYGLSGIENDQVQFLLKRILSGSDVGSSSQLTPPSFLATTTPQKQQQSTPPSPLKSPLPAPSPAPPPPPPPPPVAPLSDSEQKARVRLVQAMLDVKWLAGIGVPASHVTDSRFTALNDMTAGQEEVDDVIRRDINRTFPEHPMFSSEEGQEALFRVLKAYSLHDLEVGYCQGMAFSVGILLMYLPEEPAFRLFCRLMAPDGPNLRRMYLPGLDALKLELATFEVLLHQLHPKLYKHIQAHAVPSVLYASQWLMTIYASPFPTHFSARVIDVMLQDSNDHLLMRIALTIMAELEEALLQKDDFEDLVTCLKVTPARWGAHVLRKILNESLSSSITDAHLEAASQAATRSLALSPASSLASARNRAREQARRTGTGGGGSSSSLGSNSAGVAVGSSDLSSSILSPSLLGPERTSASNQCTPAPQSGSRRGSATPSHVISFGGAAPSLCGSGQDGSPLTGLDIIEDLIKDESLSPAAVGEMLLQGKTKVYKVNSPAYNSTLLYVI